MSDIDETGRRISAALERITAGLAPLMDSAGAEGTQSLEAELDDARRRAAAAEERVSELEAKLAELSADNAELEALRAARAAEREEIDTILAELKPLIEKEAVNA